MRFIKNKGFTLCETLVTVCIIGLILSFSLLIGSKSFKEYKRLVFEQKCLMYETNFLKIHQLYAHGRYGSTEKTKDYLIYVPFIHEGLTQEEVFVDMLDLSEVELFMYETFSSSQFDFSDYQIEYTPANLVKSFTKTPSILSIYLDDVKIVIDMVVTTTYVGANQVAMMKSVTIYNEDYSYSFVL